MRVHRRIAALVAACGAAVALCALPAAAATPTGGPNNVVLVQTTADGSALGCGSFAYARQFFLQTNGPAHLSAAGQQQVATLRQEISDAASSILPSDPLTDPCPVVPVDPLCPSREQ